MSIRVHVDGLVQDCSNSIANALELLQSCTEPSTWYNLEAHGKIKHISKSLGADYMVTKSLQNRVYVLWRVLYHMSNDEMGVSWIRYHWPQEPIRNIWATLSTWSINALDTRLTPNVFKHVHSCGMFYIVYLNLLKYVAFVPFSLCYAGIKSKSQ